MSPKLYQLYTTKFGFPRSRGDEPRSRMLKIISLKFSPLTRG
ncbi:hypothetical protein HMPREF1978_01880 [Actinomyces graevenitzii F0530]|uniref:Uncharacterized protein n=1 Tax=Actinomyces graevenitzii F0530 TaxID=1321817 RepID=U1PUN0_9ACTO|nr:hypothetical protein HMPREF1978_01880 [Actinomyces graevenitzii F0530]